MQYILIYRGYPKKSIQNATDETIVTMGGQLEVAKTYDILPMNGTLKDVLAEYVIQKKMRKSAIETLARSFGLPFDSINRPSLIRKLPQNMQKQTVNITVPKSVEEELSEIAVKENVTISKLIWILVELGLEKYLCTVGSEL